MSVVQEKVVLSLDTYNDLKEELREKIELFEKQIEVNLELGQKNTDLLNYIKQQEKTIIHLVADKTRRYEDSIVDNDIFRYNWQEEELKNNAKKYGVVYENVLTEYKRLWHEEYGSEEEE